MICPQAPAPSTFAAARSQKRELLAEQRAGWEQGEPIPPEQMLSRWPADPAADPDVASLLFEEFCQRKNRGEKPSVEEYERRFPEHKDSLASLLSKQALLHSLGGSGSSFGAPLGLPEVGDELFGFRLHYELGRGAFARVFLAEQADLAGRPVVVKVSAIEGSEPQTLAQLQHTHIVPIYSVHEDPRAGLRAVCMPYFGGVSLSRVLQALWAQPGPPVHGKQLVDTLWGLQIADCRLQIGNGKSAICNLQSAIAGMNYIRAGAWLVARLAEGLQHAHERGVLHRDVKPSNVLLSAEGQPLLLDFNLSANQNGDLAQAALGGTVAYMAPEHLRALCGQSAELVRQVDHRSDIYSLGMVLYEVMTGHSPFDQSASYSILPVVIEAMVVERSKAAPSLRRPKKGTGPLKSQIPNPKSQIPKPWFGIWDFGFGVSGDARPDIPWSLESIARKCLAPDPAERYQQAEHLAEDLRRFLDDQPLKYAPELSWSERVQKWLRRHPRLTSSGSVAAAALLVLLAAGMTLAGVHQHLVRTRDQLQTAQVRERRQIYEAGTVRAMCLVNTTLETSLEMQAHLRQGVSVCEETLAVYGVLDRDDWQEHPDWARLDLEERQRLAEDTRELLLLLAGARVRLAASFCERGRSPSEDLDRARRSSRLNAPPLGPSPEEEAVLHQALALLDRAEEIQGLPPSQALWLDRAQYLEQLGETVDAKSARQRAELTPAVTARDHYLLATSCVRQGRREDYVRGIAGLNEALRLNPRHYWSCLQRGLCHQELGNYVLAAGDFGTCIGLWPEFAWGYFNRGYALDRSGKKIEAIEDYTSALERDPEFVPAYVNRGLARLEVRQYQEALADFDQAVAGGRDDAFLHAGRGMALEALAKKETVTPSLSPSPSPSERSEATQREKEKEKEKEKILGQAAAAFQAAFARMAGLPKAQQARICCSYGFAVADRLPEEARKAFDQVLADDAHQAQALYGRAFLALQQNQVRSSAFRREDEPPKGGTTNGSVEALLFFNRAIEADPNLVEARRYRGLLLARGGFLERASQDINWCLDREPQSGPTLYTAACILAHSAAKFADPMAVDQAFDLLAKAFAYDVDRAKAAADPDLAGIRKDPRFKQLMNDP